MANVLLVEDEPLTGDVLAEFLKLQGHEVTRAENGKVALDLLHSCPAGQFDLIITDIIMPERDGFEVILALRALERPPKIIAMSGGSARLDLDLLLRSASRMRIFTVLTKPISYRELEAAVTAALKEE